jgi:hypothetical protein
MGFGEGKPKIHVEMIEVKTLTEILGRVIWEHDFHMLFDANGYVPNLGEEVKPPKSRSLYHVVGIRREYLANGVKIKVLLEKKQRRRRKN